MFWLMVVYVNCRKEVTKMAKCIVCGCSFGEKPLLEFDNMPASAQDIPTREEIENYLE